MKKINYFSMLSLILVIGISACKKNNEFKSINAEIYGFVQKGPYISGSTITIQELDNSFAPNGKTYGTVTTDDFGSFKLNSVINSQYVVVIAQGFYYDEVAGNLSSASLTLRAILKTSSKMVANVNVLTTLSENRIMFLVNNNNKSFEDAQKQAENEILKTFGISENGILNFNQMDISKEGDSNAILIALSSIIEGNNSSVAGLSEFIAKMSYDLKEDGIINNIDYLNNLIQNATNLSLNNVRVNLKNRYTQLGLTINIPQFEKYAKILVPFTIVLTNPINNKEDAVRNIITVYFNKPLDKTTINNNSFIVSSGTQKISGSYIYMDDSLSLTFIPDSLLPSLKTITATINNNLKSLDEQQLSSNYTWNFTTSGIDITRKLLVYLPFKGNPNDQSGNSNNAEIVGATLTKDRFGIDNSAFHFSDNSNYIDIHNPITLNNISWSYCLWFSLDQLPSTTDDAYLLNRFNWGNNGPIDAYLYIDNDDNAVKSWIQNGGIKVSSGLSVLANQWYHAAITYDQTTVKIYINGVLKVSSNSLFSNTNSSDLVISGPHGAIYGSVDEIRLYNRALISDEVQAIYNLEKK